AVEYARQPVAEVAGDLVTIENIRDFRYAADGTPIARWVTRTYDLRNLRGVDFFLTHWGSEFIAHPIFSFDFGVDGYLAFSVETRREQGEVFTTLGGLFKLYELTYLA